MNFLSTSTDAESYIKKKQNYEYRNEIKSHDLLKNENQLSIIKRLPLYSNGFVSLVVGSVYSGASLKLKYWWTGGRLISFLSLRLKEMGELASFVWMCRGRRPQKCENRASKGRRLRLTASPLAKYVKNLCLCTLDQLVCDFSSAQMR